VGLKRLPENARTPRWLTSEEIEVLMEAVPDRLRAVVVTFLNTGVRRGELQRLEWSDVDLNGRYLVVRNKAEGHTKSRKERIIDLNDVLLETLRHHRGEMKARFGKVPPKVFVTELGTPLGHNLLRDIRQVYASVGIQDANIHSLRHTFGAQAVMAGIDLPTLQQLMGHAEVTTTMIYVHVSRDHMRAAVNRLALGGRQREADVIPMSSAAGAVAPGRPHWGARR